MQYLSLIHIQMCIRDRPQSDGRLLIGINIPAALFPMILVSFAILHFYRLYFIQCTYKPVSYTHLPHDLFTGNTTIGAVITNGAFSKAELNKIASMTRCAYARCINPVATMADGDSIYAASIGDVSVDINMAGTLAAEVMAQAIQNAIHTSRIQDEEFLKYV